MIIRYIFSVLCIFGRVTKQNNVISQKKTHKANRFLLKEVKVHLTEQFRITN